MSYGRVHAGVRALAENAQGLQQAVALVQAADHVEGVVGEPEAVLQVEENPVGPAQVQVFGVISQKRALRGKLGDAGTPRSPDGGVDIVPGVAGHACHGAALQFLREPGPIPAAAVAEAAALEDALARKAVFPLPLGADVRKEVQVLFHRRSCLSSLTRL